MAQDHFGVDVAAGDLVNLPCRVRAVLPAAIGGKLALETVWPSRVTTQAVSLFGDSGHVVRSAVQEVVVESDVARSAAASGGQVATIGPGPVALLRRLSDAEVRAMLLQFAGFLTAALPELHGFEVPRMVPVIDAYLASLEPVYLGIDVGAAPVVVGSGGSPIPTGPSDEGRASAVDAGPGAIETSTGSNTALSDEDLAEQARVARAAAALERGEDPEAAEAKFIAESDLTPAEKRAAKKRLHDEAQGK
jgi:hypothetical protein